MRTEEQMMTQGSLKVTLGGKEYEIRPLVIRYSGEWRKKSIPIINFLLKYNRLVSSENNEEKIDQAVNELYTTKTDEIIDSFFDYARDLPKEEIMDIATDGEIILAFVEVFTTFVAPFTATLPKRVEIKTEPSL